MLHRLLNPLKSNSFFLFGARGVGKSTFLRQFFPLDRTLWIDLLDPVEADRLIRSPNELKAQLAASRELIDWIVIDEVQKVPRLLDLVHQLIESTSYKFALTGSSARKLRHGNANLLAGRAFVNHLFPLTHLEWDEHFDLPTALTFGTLPKVVQLGSNDEKVAFLRSYALTYLNEEVWAEHAVRNLDPFRKFLEIAAQLNGEPLNYTAIARDVGADVKTVQSYFQVLDDTLIGFFLEPYHPSVRKAQRVSPKFYFFDIGVKNALGRELAVTLSAPSTYGYGKAFEHFLLLECFRLNAYAQKDYRFSYLRTKEGMEVDLIIKRPGLKTALIEIKSSDHVDERDTRIIERFLKEIPNSEGFCFSQDPVSKKIGNVLALPWKIGLQALGF